MVFNPVVATSVTPFAWRYPARASAGNEPTSGEFIGNETSIVTLPFNCEENDFFIFASIPDIISLSGGDRFLVSLGKFGASKSAIVIQNLDGYFYQVGNVSFEALLTPGNTTQINLYYLSDGPSYFKNGLTYKWVAYQI